MHLFRILPVLSLFLGARASHVDTREPIPHPLDVRDTFDVCANINAELIIPDLVGKPVDFGLITGVCLCQSGISQFILSNSITKPAVDQFGSTIVTAIVTNLLLTSPSLSHCDYPDHSVPTCQSGNPCGFQCVDGFTAHPPGHPTTCQCQKPSVVCNGRCVSQGACPSQKPSNNRRRWAGSGACAEMGAGWTACGVYGGGARAWECIDTAHDLESCGGCVLPLAQSSPVGRDCTAIRGVADVSCLAGECVVRRCLKGYTSSPDGTRCYPERSTTSKPVVTGPEIDLKLVPASVYGLEHVPLERN